MDADIHRNRGVERTSQARCARVGVRGAHGAEFQQAAANSRLGNLGRHTPRQADLTPLSPLTLMLVPISPPPVFSRSSSVMLNRAATPRPQQLGRLADAPRKTRRN